MTKFSNSSIIFIILAIFTMMIKDLSEAHLIKILNKVRSIAVVGASSNQERDSYKVMKFLIEAGYKVFPVNPYEVKENILGKRCYSNIGDINEKIDMIDIFRAKEFVKDITMEGIEIGVNVIWTQEGIIDHESYAMARRAGVTFIMDKCPKKVLTN